MNVRRLVRRGLLVLIVILYAVSIPWYRSSDETPEIWLGLPSWVTVAVLCYFAVAICNAIAWLLTDVPDEPESAE